LTIKKAKGSRGIPEDASEGSLGKRYLIQRKTLVNTLLEELRARRIVCPSLPAIERLAGSVRARAQRQLWRRLADGLTDQQRQALDQLINYSRSAHRRPSVQMNFGRSSPMHMTSPQPLSVL
jgi:hypothetical protein